MSFQNNLEHARSAYLFAVGSLPDPSQVKNGPIRANGFVFDKRSQIESLQIELGWAFFCRYESCLEAHVHRLLPRVNPAKLIEWLEDNNVEIPEELRPGLEIYRKIRNNLHHRDGASLDNSPDREIHLLPEHMDRFYQLFRWCGTRVECAG